MITFTNTIQIQRPTSEVFAYLSDLENTPEWNWAISQTRKTSPGPPAVGATYRQQRTVPRPATESLEITALEADELLEVRGTLATYPAHLVYRLRPHGSGTELTNTVELRPTGPLRMLGPIAGKRIQGAVADNLRVLKSRLESGPS